MSHYAKWQRLAPAGLATIGFGLSLLGNTMEHKAAGRAWFWRGTLSLSVINAGIAMFGEAVKSRSIYEWSEIQEVN